MAPNQFHHLEGVMTKNREFRIYFYDDYVKPISPTPFKDNATVEIQRIGKDGKEYGPPLRLVVQVNFWKSYLKMSIPESMPSPLYFTVWLKFPGDDKPELFNFNF